MMPNKKTKEREEGQKEIDRGLKNTRPLEEPGIDINPEQNKSPN